jgi:hypothetical protein
MVIKRLYRITKLLLSYCDSLLLIMNWSKQPTTNHTENCLHVLVSLRLIVQERGVPPRIDILYNDTIM